MIHLQVVSTPHNERLVVELSTPLYIWGEVSIAPDGKMQLVVYYPEDPPERMFPVKLEELVQAIHDAKKLLHEWYPHVAE